MNLINKTENKNLNLGIQILRAYMSFAIVVLHFLNKKYRNNKPIKFIFDSQSFYVPTYFVISFYFSYTIFIKKNITKIKERFIRILIPYILIPLLLWIRDIIYSYHKIGKIEINYKLIKPILFQILIGYDFYAVFWFQFDLIIITLIISIIILIFNNNSIIIFKLSIPFFFIINNYYENYFQIYKQIGSIKPLLSSSIYSITGFLLRKKNILNKLNNKRYKTMILINIAFILIYKYKILIQISLIFKIIIIDITIICLFISFALLPFDFIKNNKIFF